MISDGPGYDSASRNGLRPSAPSWRRRRRARRRRGRTCSPAGRDPSCRSALPAAANLAAAPERRRLRLLAAGVRVDLGVEHEDVDVALAGQHVVEAAVADVVGPSVAADQPHALLHQVVGERLERGAPRAAWHRGQLTPQRAQRAHAARRCRLRSTGSASSSARGQRVAELRRELLDAGRAPPRVRVERQAEAEAELRVVLEERVSPTPARVRRGWSVYGVVGRLPP